MGLLVEVLDLGAQCPQVELFPWVAGFLQLPGYLRLILFQLFVLNIDPPHLLQQLIPLLHRPRQLRPLLPQPIQLITIPPQRNHLLILLPQRLMQVVDLLTGIVELLLCVGVELLLTADLLLQVAKEGLFLGEVGLHCLELPL